MAGTVSKGGSSTIQNGVDDLINNSHNRSNLDLGKSTARKSISKLVKWRSWWEMLLKVRKI